MGRSHAIAYRDDPVFQIVRLVNRSTPKLDALQSLEICLAADESARTGKPVHL